MTPLGRLRALPVDSLVNRGDGAGLHLVVLLGLLVVGRSPIHCGTRVYLNFYFKNIYFSMNQSIP